MINAFTFRLLSKPSSESIKLEVQHIQICIEINHTTISSLHKLIDKWLIQSVQNSCNSLDAFKPVLKIDFFYFDCFFKKKNISILMTANYFYVICTKFIWDVLRSCTSSTILSKNSDGVNLIILNIC